MADTARTAASRASDAASSASTHVQTTTSRLARWVEENQTLVLSLLAGSTLLAAGAGYYYYTSSRDNGGDVEKGEGAAGKSDKKKKKKSKGKKTGSGASSRDQLEKTGDEPLLEEVKPKDKTSEGEEDLSKFSETDIAALPADRRASLAQQFKATGNRLYGQKKFTEAIAMYDKAISCAPQAVFFSNRAACYANLGQPRRVVDDCNEALRLDRKYIKALNRRGVAREALGSEDESGAAAAKATEGEDVVDDEEKRSLLFEALCDFTAVAILGQFKDDSATASVERVLKKLATSKAADILRTREPRLPSPTFVSAYLEAFRPRPRPSLPPEPSQGDRTLQLAFDALNAKDYGKSLILFNESLEQGLSTKDAEAEALNMRGTFKFVIGDAKSALVDLEQSTTLKPEFVQSWVKKASVHMELSDKEAAFNDFDMAIKANPDDPDIYYHRGQVHFILGEFASAITDYQKSTSLDNTFIFSQVQLAVAQYKTGSVASSTASFRKILKQFESSSEAYNYYGELLLDQQRFQDALEKFDRAIEIERKKSVSPNVLPMINKALALFQWKQDMPAAEALCREALAIDPDCDVAVATLAQLSLQQGKIDEAIDMFDRSAKIARTEPELVNAITYENASRAQLRFIREFPEQGAALGALAGGLGA